MRFQIDNLLKQCPDINLKQKLLGGGAGLKPFNRFGTATVNCCVERGENNEFYQ